MNIVEADRFFTNTDHRIRFTVTAQDGGPQAITGWQLSWLLKKRAYDADADAKVVKTTASGGIVITDGPNGMCTVTISDTDTVAVAAGLYVHELKRTDAGLETPLSDGFVVLQQSLHLL